MSLRSFTDHSGEVVTIGEKPTIAINNPEWFKTFTFDTWYHEDTDQDWVTDEFFNDNVSFYKFFETIN